MRTHEEFIKELYKISPDIEVIGTYTRAVDRIAVKCKVCGRTWEPRAYYLTQGNGCAHCSALRGAKVNKGKTGQKTHAQFVEEMKRVHPSIIVVGEYANTHDNIECECSICSHQWTAKPYSLLQGHGCPRCVKSGTSFMEQFIRLSFVRALGENAVLSRDRTAIGMELDIYIPSMSIAIEPGNWYLHKKYLQKDVLKREKCAASGIRLFTIYDKCAKDAVVPFTNDCFAFVDDLNKTDRSIIQKLVGDLFATIGLAHSFTDKEWKDIETEAYNCAKAKTHGDFIKEMSALHPSITVIGQYQNANKRIRVQCERCNREWDAVPASLLSGDGCRKCGTKAAHQQFVKGQHVFEEQVRSVNPTIQILGEYVGRHSRVHAKCLVCGFEWYPVAASLLRGSSHKGWQAMHKELSGKN